MLYEDKSFKLKDGRSALLRSPRPADDARGLLDYLRTISTETDFVLRTPEECDDDVDKEERYLLGVLDSPSQYMILCEVDGEIAGNCTLTLRTRQKVQHRGSIAIAMVSKFWNLGIGSQMMTEMIRLAEEAGLHQLELEVIEGNSRAIALYQKHGFRLRAVHPDFIRARDGSLRDEYLMIRNFPVP